MHLMVPESTPVEDPLALYEHRRQPRAPRSCWVMANMVAGLDGSAAVQGRVGPLSTGPDARLFERMRTLADVVLVGAETVRREGYGVRLPADVEATRREAGRAPLRVAVVSASLELADDLPLFRDADADHRPIVLTTALSDRAKLDGVPVEVIVAGDSRVDPARALTELAARHLPVVLCEGGPQLLGAVIAADMLDEYLLTLTPLIGGDRLPVVDTTDIAQLHRFDLAHVAEEDGSLFLRYLRRGGR